MPEQRRARGSCGKGDTGLIDWRKHAAIGAVILTALSLSGCSGRAPRGIPMAATTDERECLVRAMYFESNRSSYDGSLAVGTVVMNRVESQRFPSSICGVVGQRKQFAPGVLTRKMDPKQMKPALHAADAVLKGGRHPKVGPALHFHAASYKNPYPAKYVTVAGGNAFYLRPGKRWASEYLLGPAAY
ncbi:MAG: cell wall hydrolase [Pseudomonadota bacterium]